MEAGLIAANFVKVPPIMSSQEADSGHKGATTNLKPNSPGFLRSNGTHSGGPVIQPQSAPSTHVATMENTPTRSSRPTDNDNNFERDLLRSSSVPSLTTHPTQQYNHKNAQNSLDENSPLSNESGTVLKTETRHSTSSVKHLTCFWWKEKGSCRFKDDDCLYAHRDTGHYTDPPRQLIPGEPALAGRKLDRAMRNLSIAAHRSSGSLSSMVGSRQPSRPSTPVLRPDPGLSPTINLNSPMVSPLTVVPHYNTNVDLARLSSDNQFLRNLVDQNGKEKAVLVSTVESLQADNKGMRGELDGLRKAQEQLLTEREGLRNRIKQLEGEHYQNFASGATRSVSSPFGTIGRGRVNTETRYLGGLLTDD